MSTPAETRAFWNDLVDTLEQRIAKAQVSRFDLKPDTYMVTDCQGCVLHQDGEEYQLRTFGGDISRLPTLGRGAAFRLEGEANRRLLGLGAVKAVPMSVGLEQFIAHLKDVLETTLAMRNKALACDP